MKTFNKSLCRERAGVVEPTGMILLALLGMAYYFVMLVLAAAGAPMLAF